MEPETLINQIGDIVTAAITAALANSGSAANPTLSSSTTPAPRSAVRPRAGPSPSISAVATDSEDEFERPQRRHSLPTLFVSSRNRKDPKRRRGPIIAPSVGNCRPRGVDVVCLPYVEQDVILIPRGKNREQLAAKNLIGKVTLWSAMTETEVKYEIGSIFLDPFDLKVVEEFSFAFLDIMGGSKKLQVPKVSPSFKWNGAEVLRLVKSKCIYVMAAECHQLKSIIVTENSVVHVASREASVFIDNNSLTPRDRSQLQLAEILNYDAPPSLDYIDDDDVVVQLHTYQDSPADILKKHIEKILCITESQHIYVRRNNLLTDAVKAILAPKFDPTKTLNIHFIGEAGVDLGGPRKEFLDSLLGNLLQWQVFQGESGALTLSNHISSLINNLPFAAGVIVGLILCQGHTPAPLFAKSLLYSIANIKYSYSPQDIPDRYLRNMIITFQDSDSIIIQNSELQALAEEMCYYKSITQETKNDFVATVSQYLSVVKNGAHISQFAKGLNTLGIDVLIQEHPDQMLFLLCGDSYVAPPMDGNTIYSDLHFNFSEEGSNQLMTEQEATLYLMEFLSGCCCADGQDAHNGNGEPAQCCIRDFLQFITGLRRVPIIEVQKPTVNFGNQPYPTANVCSSTLTLPLNLDSDTFKHRLTEAILGSPEFGQV